ncbi:CPBP family intramembrane glutamic endopeptidase [uncultured Porphyromonas sp.]|uniref:CPBP family intramembrane glutamic endopeptidase n=1 Tax=uncultured Porphyromonas sp. TaxID=159274 RepID=UPI002619FD3D|nr:CPBP family intramembrane glutamic endopeptidase [uncultured Porphyromonas sp.]
MILHSPARLISPRPGISPAKEILVFILSLLLGFGLFGAIYALLSPLLSHSIFGIAITQNVVVFLGSAVLYAYFVFYRKAPKALGLRAAQPIIRGKNRWYEGAIILGITLLVWGLSALLQYAVGEAIQALPKDVSAWISQFDAESEAMLEKLQNDREMASRLKQLLIIGILTGICEEILLRGALQPLLIRLTHSPIAGILLTAIIFSLLHQSVLNFLPIMVLALWFGCLRHYSGSIVWGVLIHILNNSLALF